MNNLVLPSWVTPEMLRHFKIEGPAKISFSGGRTSALMLYLVLMANGGTLPEDVKVLFANTGKEREATMPIEAKIIPHKHDETAAQPVLAIGDEYLVRVVPGKEPKAQSHPFRIDAPRYKDLFTISQQPMLDIPLDELEGEAIDDIGDCFCNAA